MKSTTREMKPAEIEWLEARLFNNYGKAVKIKGAKILSIELLYEESNILRIEENIMFEVEDGK